MKINIYLSRNGFYSKIARVDKTKVITADVWKFFPAGYLGGAVDIHYTYPSDGSFHITAKLGDGTELKVFDNRAAIKKSNQGSFQKISKDDAMQLLPIASMVPDYKPKTFAEYETVENSFFPLMMLAMGSLRIFDVESPKKTDFVIDCNNVNESRTPNFSIMLIGKNTNPYPLKEFIGQKIFFDKYPKVFVGLFYGSD